MRDLINIVENALSPAQTLTNEVRSNDRVSLDLRVVSPDRVSIEQVWSERERGKGHATAMMKSLVSAADRLGVTLTLEASPLYYDTRNGAYDNDDRGANGVEALNDKALSYDQLVKWYKSFGFKVRPTDDPDCAVPMIRFPRMVEERLPDAKTHWGQTFHAYENPTKEEFLHALETATHHALRAIVFENGEVIIWDSEAALHSDVDQAYGTSGGFNITIWSSHIDCQGNPKKEVRAAIKNNPVLVGLGVNKARFV